MEISTPKFKIFAPAKINLHLRVLDKQKDGFHNLESLFLAVDFGDTLYFEENDIDIITPFIENNIIFRALSLFREKTGFSKSYKITVEKRIPLGGGLGGGSSDAAATLLALNELAGFPLGDGCIPSRELLEMAGSLGSDVPFFIHRTPAAWVTGRGERVQPLEVSDWWFVLVNPGFKSDTGVAFKLLDEYRGQGTGDREQGAGSREWGVGKEKRRKKKEVDKLSFLHSSFFSLLYNDFLPVFLEPQKSTYESIISSLLEAGASYANLSGSGSTCFGVFTDKEQAEKAARAACNLTLNGELCQVYRYSHSE